jgi:hypothetical protein
MIEKPMESQAIVDKMLATYRALDTYQDRGYILDIRRAGTKDESKTKIEFTTFFKRSEPYLFRFDWQHPSPEEANGVWTAAIWSDGQAVYGYYPAVGLQEEDGIGSAIGSGAGALSGGAAYKSLFLLMTELEDDCAHHFPLTGFQWVSSDYLSEDLCHHLQKVVVSQALSVRETDLWISANRLTLLKVRETEISDNVRFDAWHQGLLRDDPIENERVIEKMRCLARRRSEFTIEKYAREHNGIEDWRKRSIQLGSEPQPIITETFYTDINLNCQIENESSVFGKNF